MPAFGIGLGIGIAWRTTCQCRCAANAEIAVHRLSVRFRQHRYIAMPAKALGDAVPHTSHAHRLCLRHRRLRRLYFLCPTAAKQ